MLSVWSRLKRMHTGFVERRRDRRSRAKQQKQQHFRWKRSLSGVFTANCSEEQEDSLDVSKHRCSSIESLLSLEQSFVTYDDQNNIRLVPRVCLSNAGNNKIPLEVGIPNDNHNSEDPVMESDSNVGLDISGSSDEDEGAVATEESKDKEEGNAFKENSSTESQVKATAELQSAKECLQSAALEARRNISSILPLSSTIMLNDATILKAVTKPPPEDCQTILRNSFSKIANTTANRDSGSNRSTSVRFGSVEVHQHEQGLGQSSVPMCGPPLGLGWKRISYEKYASVDEHLEKHAQRGGQPRSLKQLFQPSRQRVDTLLRLGCSLREIRHATRETGVIKTKRLHSSRYSDRSKSFVCVFISKIFKTFICLPHRNKTKMKASQDAGQSSPNKKAVPTTVTNIDDTVRTQDTIGLAR